MTKQIFRAAAAALVFAFAPACPSGDPSASTGSDTDIASTGNVPTTSSEPEACVDPDVVCDRLVTNAADFCDAIVQFGATRSIEEPYIGFVVAKCEANEPKCEVCFELENYCVQIGEACQGLKSLCACVGEAFDVP